MRYQVKAPKTYRNYGALEVEYIRNLCGRCYLEITDALDANDIECLTYTAWTEDNKPVRQAEIRMDGYLVLLTFNDSGYCVDASLYPDA